MAHGNGAKSRFLAKAEAGDRIGGEVAEKVDVLIVGSGHSGGMAAKVLTGKGIQCLMLNAGPIPDYEKDRETQATHELPYHGFNTPGRLPNLYQATEFNSNQWVDQKEVPYTFDREQPYNWVRVRLFGGRSLFWARQSFRYSDFEFGPAIMTAPAPTGPSGWRI